jgi:hypothetical protein
MKLQIKNNKVYNGEGEQVGSFSQDEIELDNDSLRHEVIRQAALYKGRNLENRSTEAIREQGQRIIQRELDSIEAENKRSENYAELVISLQRHIEKLNSELETLRQ